MIPDERPPIEVLRQASPSAADSFQSLRAAVEDGVLDSQTIELVLVAVLAATRQDASMSVHARRALALGVSPEALRHAVVATLAAGALFNDAVGALRAIDRLAQAQTVTTLAQA
jgi:alkylhydroperoxidase/carboxymuconolactone decarboxylase family protein YurZ